MKTFQQNGINYLVVEVPEGAGDYEIAHINQGDCQERYLFFWQESGLIKATILMDNKDYSIIGLLPSITEEQAKEMCERDKDCGEFISVTDGRTFWTDYQNTELALMSAVKSLKSRLRSLGFETENILIIKQLT